MLNLYKVLTFLVRVLLGIYVFVAVVFFVVVLLMQGFLELLKCQNVL